MFVTASKLYDFIQCPHRVWRDKWGPQDERDTEPNPFVQLLWERGVAYERERLALAGDVVNIAELPIEDRPGHTLSAMRACAPLIYQGTLQVDNLVGVPDFLRREPDGTYVPIDVKSGMGVEGTDSDESDETEGKPKKHYAAQLALYVDALQRLGFAAQQRGIILDVRGREVVYDLSAAQGKRTPETYWQFYERTRDAVAALLDGTTSNSPALAGACKLCPWHTSCTKWVEQADDPTGVFYIGRSVRDTLAADAEAKTVSALCNLDIQGLLERKKRDKGFLKGLGESTLAKAVARAKILRERQPPVLYEDIEFQDVTYELFFDIEDDPTQEFVYMHGVCERTPTGTRYLDFTATEVSEAAEREAWAGFWGYVRALPGDDYVVYYYSKHERTTYRKMRERYPDIATAEEIEKFFDPVRAIDLYSDVVLKLTDWPVGSYSIKSLAQYLGFEWRDPTPSGALSIQWFNSYLATKDPALLNRIRQYNEDDCRAMLVLKDALIQLSVERLAAEQLQ